MSPTAELHVFMLGATGYLGSQFLVELSRAEKVQTFRIIALVRNLTPEKEAKLKGIYRNLHAIEGDLDSGGIIQEQVSKADIVINCASSDHWPCVRATLAGLEERSAQNPGNPPLYIHVSGLGILSDNSRGGPAKRDEYTDIGFTLEQCPSGNEHLHCDIPISQAGTRKENPIRTIILYPGWIHGLGEGSIFPHSRLSSFMTRVQGVQEITAAIKIVLNVAKSAGHAGTWGEGHNKISNIHVKDVANAIVVLLEAALQGNAGAVGAGAHELYFATGQEKVITCGELMGKMGDILYRNGIVKSPDSKPYPDEALAPLGNAGWSMFGGNLLARSEKLLRLGWEPTETKKIPLLETLAEEVELAAQEIWKE
uniref:NAD-dependent epimerase/dehydratase domain-containing protein n=1 Tax=Moniliophthora roreri TaxID=221103 RepID=A0A0W0FRM0_MONRR